MRLGPHLYVSRQRRVERPSPKDWVDDVRQRVEAGRSFTKMRGCEKNSHRQCRTGSFLARQQQHKPRRELAFAARPVRYAAQCLGWKSYLRQPGDGRPQPRIAARHLVVVMFDRPSAARDQLPCVEQLVHSVLPSLYACRSLLAMMRWLLHRTFGPGRYARRLIVCFHRAKRKQKPSRIRGRLAWPDGTNRRTTAFTRLRVFAVRSTTPRKEVIGYSHQMVSISVVGTGLSSLRRRTLRPWRQRSMPAASACSPEPGASWALAFADYLVVDGGYATAPFLPRPPIAPAFPSSLASRTTSRNFSIRGTALPRLLLDQRSIAMAKTVWRSGMRTTSPLGRPCVGTAFRVIRYRQHRPDQYHGPQPSG